MTNEEFKNKLSNIWKWIKRVYIIGVTILCISWSPYIKYTVDNSTTMLSFNFPFFKKDILISEG